MAEVKTKTKIVLGDATAFNAALKAIKGLVSEATIKLSAAGLEIVSMDPANVAMVLFKMGTSEFVQWDVSEDTKLRVKLEDLTKVLQRGAKDTPVALIVEQNKLDISIGKKDFKIALIDDGEEKEQKVPDLKFNVTAVLTRDAFADVVDDADLFSESVLFSVGQDKKLVAKSKGDTNEGTVEVEATVTVDNAEKSTAKSKFSVEYLKKMTQARIGKNVKLQIATDYPLMLDCSNDKGSISLRYILAPRVEND